MGSSRLLCIAGIALVVASGCASSSTDTTAAPSKLVNLPANAPVVEDGMKDLAFTARTEGTVYVYDINSQSLVYMGQMLVGEKIEVMPDTDTMSRKGKDLKGVGLDPTHRYRIYFVKTVAPAS